MIGVLEGCLEYLSEFWNQFNKLLGVRITGMQSKEESKGGESASLLSPSPRISGMRFILRGVEL